MKIFIRTIIAIFFASSFFSFGWLSHPKYEPPMVVEVAKIASTLDNIKANKKLNVVLLNAPSIYYIGTEGEQGFEYDLLKNYAKHLDVELNITIATTLKEALELSQQNNIHITSSAIAKTSKRVEKYNFGPSYFEIQEQVICNREMIRNSTFPRTVDDLAGLSITVGESTSYSETLEALQNEGYDINVTLTSAYTTQELFDKVSKKEIDCTVADSNIFTLNQRYFTKLTRAFNISAREQLAWILPKNAKELESDMYSWLNGFVQDGSMAELKDHYYSHIIYFDYYDTTMFHKRIKSRLPKYEKIFRKAEEKYSVPWKLLASISYQESYWNPYAKSFTGVRGMMMLTRYTAKLLGVKNRLNATQSIYGGTRHLKSMLRLVPKEVEGENRLKFALAAYNVGMGHIRDAQKLAKKMGYNENIWKDMKMVLPLLSQKKYYKHLKYGYARGSEPVRYVDAIYNFRDILQTLTAPKDINSSKS